VTKPTFLPHVSQVHEESEPASYRVRVASESAPQAVTSTLSHTGLVDEAWSRLSSFMLPLTIAASFFVPDVETVTRYVRTRTSTSSRVSYLGDWVAESPWELVLEPVNPAEVEELRRIWALPYAGPPDFEFFASSD